MVDFRCLPENFKKIYLAVSSFYTVKIKILVSEKYVNLRKIYFRVDTG